MEEITSKRKGYEEKRNHIIMAANTLFLEKGYEATSVDDVLELAKISKGTFYHYFNHKIELLESIVDMFTLSYCEPLDKITSSTEMSAIDKLNAFFKLNQILKKENQAILLQVIAIWYKEENLIFKLRLSNRIKEVITPYLVRIIEQGSDEGFFKTNDTKETAALIVQLIAYMRERFVEELVKSESDVQTMNNLIRICQQCIERLLAIPEGSLIIFPAGYIDDYISSQ